MLPLGTANAGNGQNPAVEGSGAAGPALRPCRPPSPAWLLLSGAGLLAAAGAVLLPYDPGLGLGLVGAAVLAAACSRAVWVAMLVGFLSPLSLMRLHIPGGAFLVGFALPTGMVLALAVALLLTRRSAVPVGPVELAVVALGAWSWITAGWSHAPLDSVLWSGRLGVMVALVLSLRVVVMRYPNASTWLWIGFLLGSLVLCASALADLLQARLAVGRLSVWGLNANRFAYYAACGAVVGCGFATIRRGIAGGAAAMASVAMALAVLASGSRTAIAACAVGVLWLLGRAPRAALKLVLVGALAAGVVAWASTGGDTHGLWGVQRLLGGPSAVRAGFTGRSTLWRAGGEMALGSPLGGLGAGSFPDQCSIYMAQAGIAIGVPVAFPPSPHSICVGAIAEQGLVGLGLLLFALLATWPAGRRAAGLRTNPGVRLAAAVLLTSLVAGLCEDVRLDETIWMAVGVIPSTAYAAAPSASQAEPPADHTTPSYW